MSQFTKTSIVRTYCTETPMTHKRKNKRQRFFSTYCKKVSIALRSILLLYYEGTVCPPIFTEEYIIVLHFLVQFAYTPKEVFTLASTHNRAYWVGPQGAQK